MYWPETALERLVIVVILSPIVISYVVYMFLKDVVTILYDWCEAALVVSVTWITQGETDGVYMTKLQRHIEKLKESEKESNDT